MKKQQTKAMAQLFAGADHAMDYTRLLKHVNKTKPLW